MSMPLITTLRLTVYALPYYSDFLPKNSENLLKKVTCLAKHVSIDFIFASLIELLPGTCFQLRIT